MERPFAVRPGVAPGAGVAHVLVGRDRVLVKLAVGERGVLHRGTRGAEVVLKERGLKHKFCSEF